MASQIVSITLLAAFVAGCVRVDPHSQSLANNGYTSADQQCLSQALYHEARGTVDEGLRAVGEVILNRANDERFPATICGVIDQRFNGSCQFSYRCDSIPDDVYNEPNELARVQDVAFTLLTDRGADITGGALYFHAASMRAGWFATLSPRGRFGGNIFYR